MFRNCYMKITFIQGYGMHLEDFEVLVELLRNDIAPNFRQSNRRCEELIYTFNGGLRFTLVLRFVKPSFTLYIPVPKIV
jgi:hypothetical protein